jgi:hypothetical protein
MVGSAASAEMLRRLEQLQRDEAQQVAEGDDAEQWVVPARWAVVAVDGKALHTTNCWKPAA